MEELSTRLRCAHALIEVTPRLTTVMRKDLRIHSAGLFTEPQFRVMAYLFREGEACLSTLADFQGVSLPTMSKLIQGLESRGLVLREKDLCDRRRVALNLTPAGREAYEGLLRRTEAHIVQWISTMSEEECVAVLQALIRVDTVFSQVDLDAFYALAAQ